MIRINSQSGKGGVAFVMDTFYGFKLPKGMHKEFADVIQAISEKQGEVAPEQIMEEFKKDYLDRKEPMHFRKCRITDTETADGEFATLVKLTYTDHGIEKYFDGIGNGPIDAVQRGLEEALGIQIKVLHRACTGIRFRRTGCFLHPLSRPEYWKSNLRRRHQLQYYQSIYPRYLQCCEQTVLLMNGKCRIPGMK